MTNNEYVKIKAINNGFTLEHELRERNPSSVNPDNWDYVENNYAFTNWADVVSWLTANPMTFPPSKI